MGDAIRAIVRGGSLPIIRGVLFSGRSRRTATSSFSWQPLRQRHWLFLTNTTATVGSAKQYEGKRETRNGSMMINAVRIPPSRTFLDLFGGSYGAGNYGIVAGAADVRSTLSTVPPGRARNVRRMMGGTHTGQGCLVDSQPRRNARPAGQQVEKACRCRGGRRQSRRRSRPSRCDVPAGRPLATGEGSSPGVTTRT